MTLRVSASPRFVPSFGWKKACGGLLVAGLVSVGAVGWGAPGDSGGSRGLKIEDCKISVINDIEIPAEEPGPIIKLLVAEESVVKKDQLVAQMDDRLAKQQLLAAQSKHLAAAEQAKNDVNYKYAVKAAEHAKVEYEKSKEATRQTKNAVADIDIKRFLLAWQKADLMAEQAQLEQRVAVHTAAAEAAEAEAAKLAIARRQLKSPIDGVVVDVPKKAGEWAAAGDPVVRILQMDKLRVEGFFDIAKYPPHKIRGAAVTLEVEVGGEIKKFPGKVVMINPEAIYNGATKLWAEVENRQENGEWVLRPGMKVTEMVVDTDFVPAGDTARHRRSGLE
ncbi:MAG: HlyD family efflux transporter periplasmic adaptor subunit [Pirellulales bacterium]